MDIETSASDLLDFAKYNGYKSDYLDRKSFSSLEAQNEAKKISTTVYVGNLSFYTSESQIYNFFSQVGKVKRVIMGLNKNTKKPCGFCFVVYTNRTALLAASNFLNDLFLDGKRIKVEVDPGFIEGRQFGRGQKGMQLQDERRKTVDYFRSEPNYKKSRVN